MKTEVRLARCSFPVDPVNLRGQHRSVFIFTQDTKNVVHSFIRRTTDEECGASITDLVADIDTRLWSSSAPTRYLTLPSTSCTCAVRYRPPVRSIVPFFSSCAGTYIKIITCKYKPSRGPNNLLNIYAVTVAGHIIDGGATNIFSLYLVI